MSFSKNVLILVSGTTIAQAIPIILTPILTRIYGPSDFGILSFYLAIVTILGVIVTGRYELGIVLPSSNDEAKKIASLAIFCSVVISLISLLTIVIFHKSIFLLFSMEDMSTSLYLVPFSLLSIGILSTLNYYNSRTKSFIEISKFRVLRTVLIFSFQFCLGVLFVLGDGLVLGHVIGGLAISLLWFSRSFSDVFQFMKFRELKSIAIKYSTYPKHSMPAALTNETSINFLNILVSSFFGFQTLGFYALIQRVLGLPTSIIGRAFSQVFYKEIVDEKEHLGNGKEIFKRTLVKLSIISIFLFTILFYIVEELFVIFFGSEWQIAGAYARILIPLYAIRFVVSSLSMTLSAFKKEKLALKLQILLLACTMSSFFWAIYQEYNFKDFLYLYTSILICFYIYYLIVLYQTSLNKENK